MRIRKRIYIGQISIWIPDHNNANNTKITYTFTDDEFAHATVFMEPPSRLHVRQEIEVIFAGSGSPTDTFYNFFKSFY